MSSLKVAVRARPLNSRESDTESCITFDLDQNAIQIKNEAKDSTFAFDLLYPPETPQENMFCDIGIEMLDYSFQGYNACILAYGQTGSGKSFTMMGKSSCSENSGIIPRLCNQMFDRIEADTIPNTNPENCKKEARNPFKQFTVEASYFEIYSERVFDLLNPSTGNASLKVREHPIVGPYVEGLSRCVVSSFSEIEKLMDEGNKARTVAATNMNSESSRSHGIFNLILTEQSHLGEKVSKISLVDLAGSERAKSTQAKGDRLKEGANINKSLTCLGKVISSLASVETKKKSHIPYRDSILTWILKENLGGNSKTAMIATISPSIINFDETLSTLRYADRAKQIKCHAIVNEDPNVKLIRELKEEILHLKSSGVQNSPREESTETSELRDQLKQAEMLIAQLTETSEEKLKRTNDVTLEREKMFQQAGIAVNKKGSTVGVFSNKTSPHLVNLNEDPLMDECLLYYIPVEKSTALGSDPENEIVLNDPIASTIQPYHAVFTCEDVPDKFPVVRVKAVKGNIYVNGREVITDSELSTGDRLLVGDQHLFRFTNPLQAKYLRNNYNKELQSIKDGSENVDKTGSGSGVERRQSYNWNFAREELLNNSIDIVKNREQRFLEIEEQYMRGKLEADGKLETKRRELEKSAGGKTKDTQAADAKNQLETSWNLMSELRNVVGPEEMKKLVAEHGLPASASGNLKVEDYAQGELDIPDEKLDSVSQVTSSTNAEKWMTISEIKTRTLKEVCYTIALGEFNMPKEQIIQITTKKFQDLLFKFGKKDGNELASIDGLVMDVYDTFGIKYDMSEFKNKTVDDSELSTMKEQINTLTKKFEQKEKIQKQASSWRVLEDRMVDAISKDGWISPAYVPSTTFDQPSPGIVVPDHLEGDERIAWLMENDSVFRRGRLNWLKRQDKFQKDLQKREANKKIREQQRLELAKKKEQAKSTGQQSNDSPKKKITFSKNEQPTPQKYSNKPEKFSSQLYRNKSDVYDPRIKNKNDKFNTQQTYNRRHYSNNATYGQTYQSNFYRSQSNVQAPIRHQKPGLLKDPPSGAEKFSNFKVRQQSQSFNHGHRQQQFNNYQYPQTYQTEQYSYRNQNFSRDVYERRSLGKNFAPRGDQIYHQKWDRDYNNNYSNPHTPKYHSDGVNMNKFVKKGSNPNYKVAMVKSERTKNIIPIVKPAEAKMKDNDKSVVETNVYVPPQRRSNK